VTVLLVGEVATKKFIDDKKVNINHLKKPLKKTLGETKVKDIHRLGNTNTTENDNYNQHYKAIPNHNSKHFKENNHQLTHKPMPNASLQYVPYPSEKPLQSIALKSQKQSTRKYHPK
jgi:hypothetical protein